MSELHIPVMFNEILEHLSPAIAAVESPRFFDGTFGRGGHLSALLQKFANLQAVAVDQDHEAIEFGKVKFANEIQNGRLQLFHQNFSQFDVARLGHFHAMLIDLGVSSPQLDQGNRGFSFYHDGPLDMRMDHSQGVTAADLIASLGEEELIELFRDLGEVPRPSRVVRAIVHDRKQSPFLRTRQLAGLIERVEGWHRKGYHPATQYFMALRLRVNAELDVLENSIANIFHGLMPRGRLAVLTFHSLEDRIMKNKMREFPELGGPLFKKVIQPNWTEQKQNPRARSAKLRIFERSSSVETETETET